MTVVGAVRSYDELTGARGREMFYRSERFKAAYLFKRGVPSLIIESAPFTLHDVSLTGLSATTTHDVNYVRAAGQPVAIQLKVKDEPLFEALGEVVRTDPRPHNTKIGVRFVDRSIDIAQVVRRYQEAKTQADLDQLASADAEVSAEYRQLCADVLHLFRAHCAVLDRFEATKPDADAASGMLAACEQRIMPHWRELWKRGNTLVAAMKPGDSAWRAAKRYTELVLTPDSNLGAFARRCYQKPLGYPGDFEIMNMAYDWRYEGERLSDKLMHRVGLKVGECIATRMTVMRQEIAELALSAVAEPARITSLGSGPAREVIDYLKVPTLPHRVEFTLIDQDRGALSQAYERSLPQVMRHQGRAAVACLHASFSQLLAAGELFGKLPSQNLIYSVGLIDYLTARRAKSLIEGLYHHIVPGGELIVANMKSGPGSTLWPMEFISDWTLIYRDAQDLRTLAADLPGASLSIADDSTGHVCILTARKR